MSEDRRSLPSPFTRSRPKPATDIEEQMIHWRRCIVFFSNIRYQSLSVGLAPNSTKCSCNVYSKKSTPYRSRPPSSELINGNSNIRQSTAHRCRNWEAAWGVRRTCRRRETWGASEWREGRAVDCLIFEVGGGSRDEAKATSTLVNDEG